MANEKRLIDANVLMDKIKENGNPAGLQNVTPNDVYVFAIASVETAPTVDAVEMETLKAWLYEIAMNNTGNYLCNACEEIISRLDGLRTFAKERKE